MRVAGREPLPTPTPGPGGPGSFPPPDAPAMPTVCLLLLTAAAAGPAPAPPGAGGPAPTRHALIRDDASGLAYWWHEPAPGAGGAAEAGGPRPLLIFLHGGGESGGDPAKVLTHGLPKLIEGGLEVPVWVAAPHNPGENKFWDDTKVAALARSIAAARPVDPARIYITGLSRGGYGTWRCVLQDPDLYAAAVPIAGGGYPPYAFRIPHVPIWAFHGEDDGIIPPSESADMVAAINARGGKAKLTLYPGVGHAGWDETYQNPELWRWLLAQRRPAAEEK